MTQVRDTAAERRLLDRLRAGDVAAFAELLDLHRDYLLRVAEFGLDRQLRRRLDASDIVQDAQLDATRRLTEYLDRSDFPARLWLRQLVLDRLGAARRHHAGAARRAVGNEVAWPEHSSLLLARRLAGSTDSPAAELDRREQTARVRAAVTRLSAEDREILQLRTYEGLSFGEIAAWLQIDAATARKRHGRALLRLYRLLAEPDPGGGES